MHRMGIKTSEAGAEIFYVQWNSMAVNSVVVKNESVLEYWIVEYR